VAAGNTHGLNKVYSTTVSYAPNNFLAQNNLAATSLLLRLNLSKAHALAKEVFTQHPKEAIVTSTYAYSLHLQGRTKEGLAVLEKLKPEALETPSIALYYGVLLSASGETNKAGKYLSIAQKAELLPEEKALAAEAVRQAGSGS
jgi:Flp pilus assembly protein TadD